jgi:hypothetical protein
MAKVYRGNQVDQVNQVNQVGQVYYVDQVNQADQMNQVHQVYRVEKNNNKKSTYIKNTQKRLLQTLRGLASSRNPAASFG